MRYSIIPELSDIQRTLDITEQYTVNWEYNDFLNPEVYDNPLEIDRRIELYLQLKKDRSMDTMHGAFLGLDVAAKDPIICERSKALHRHSMDIARRLGVKGVVFHTGLIGGLRLPYYINNWLNMAEQFYKELCKNYSEINIYIENSFENGPEVFVNLMERMKGVNNFKICFDYGHAILSTTPIEDWVSALAPYIGHMHLNDNDLKNDLHMIPGTASIDYIQWRELLIKYNIETSVLLELNGNDNIEEALKYMHTITE